MFFYLEETAEFSSYTLKLFINKYIKFHLYQEAGLYFILWGKLFYLEIHIKITVGLKKSKKMLTLKSFTY